MKTMVKHPNKKGPSKDNSNKPKGNSKPSGKPSRRGKPPMKFSPLDSKGQTAQVPYAKVKEALVHAILKEGGTGASDVAQSIMKEEVLDIPKPTHSRSRRLLIPIPRIVKTRSLRSSIRKTSAVIERVRTT